MRSFVSTIDLQRFTIVGLLVFATGACSTHVGNPEDEGGSGVRKNRPDLIRTPGEPVDERAVFSLTRYAYGPAAEILLYIDSFSLRAAGDEDESSSPWIVVDIEQDEPINLLDLDVGELFSLAASEEIPYGAYSQARLILAADKAASITLENGESHDLRVPSGDTSGLIVKGEMNIQEDSNNHFVIGFDLNRSIVRTGPGNSNNNGNPPAGRPNQGNGAANRPGGYLLKPVFFLAKEDQSGAIGGVAANGSIVCVYESISEADTSSTCENAVVSGPVENGVYEFPFLPAGNYDLRIFDSQGAFQDVLGESAL